jgi:hypothetical protein
MAATFSRMSSFIDCSTCRSMSSRTSFGIRSATGDRFHSRVHDFETIAAVAAAIADAGAPLWAKRLLAEPSSESDSTSPAVWRGAWDHAAADANLARIDARDRLIALARDREAADSQRRKLFGELVRELTFEALERRLSPSIKAALVEFVRALARIGKGNGKAAGTHRHSAREAMSRCYDAVPCGSCRLGGRPNNCRRSSGFSNLSLSTKLRNPTSQSYRRSCVTGKYSWLAMTGRSARQLRL